MLLFFNHMPEKSVIFITVKKKKQQQRYVFVWGICVNLVAL